MYDALVKVAKAVGLTPRGGHVSVKPSEGRVVDGYEVIEVSNIVVEDYQNGHVVYTASVRIDFVDGSYPHEHAPIRGIPHVTITTYDDYFRTGEGDWTYSTSDIEPYELHADFGL